MKNITLLTLILSSVGCSMLKNNPSTTNRETINTASFEYQTINPIPEKVGIEFKEGSIQCLSGQNRIPNKDIQASLSAKAKKLEIGEFKGKEYMEVKHLKAKNDIKFNIGDQWTYEEEEYIGGGNAYVKYASFVVTDTMKEEVLTKYVLNEEDTFYVQDDKMFFWDEHYQEYIMHYDFNSTSSYDIKYYDPFRKSDEIATVFIDSVGYRHFGNDSLKAQHIHVLNSGTIEDYQEIIYEGIGAENYGIKLVLGCGLCDFNPYITKLRCFSSNMMTYSFVAYACDSTWFTTDTKEIDAENIKIYPNPTTHLVWIDGIDQDIAYELHTATGKLIQKGCTKDKSVFIEGNGIFILRLNDKNNWINKRVVKIE